MSLDSRLLTDYLGEVKSLVLDEITQQLQLDESRPGLYSLMMDYPLRGGKGLRPALAVAACRCLGGSLDAIIPTAATLELYHNAFLIHDDVEDESLARRGRPTLHVEHGVPIAVNVGDAMLCLSLQPLLDNMSRVGLGAALRILDVISTMTRHSVEGQAVELEWIRSNEWRLVDDDYVQMVIAKTGWYSFIAPLQIGVIAAGGTAEQAAELESLGTHLSVAFQITDDLLNLDAAADSYGKELAGDLWEGKRTLPLLHALHSAPPADRDRALAVLAKPRPGGRLASVRATIDQLRTEGRIGAAEADELIAATDGAATPKTEADVMFLADLIDRYESVGHATDVARRHIGLAEDALSSIDWFAPSRHRDMIAAVVEYVHERRN